MVTGNIATAVTSLTPRRPPGCVPKVYDVAVDKQGFCSKCAERRMIGNLVL
jgi:hypothetical protein